MAASQFYPGGVPDSNFGTDGLYNFDTGHNGESANAIALAGDAKLILGGVVLADADRRGTAVARLLIGPPDPYVDANRRLVITGSDGNDVFELRPKGTDDISVTTSVNTFTVRRADFDDIAVHGLGGNDSLTVAPDLGRFVLYYGGAGGDALHMTGSAGPDVPTSTTLLANYVPIRR